MRFRKVLSLALALCLLMTLLPLQTFAAAEKQTDKQAPLYAQLKDSAHYPKITIQEVEPDTAEATEDSDALWEGTKTYAPTYLTVEEAAVKLRGYLKERRTSFDLYVKSENPEYNQVANELLLKATVHTGKPTEGDYLLWNLKQWNGKVDPKFNGSYCTFHYELEMSYYTTADQEKELTTAVNSLLKTLDVKNKSDYEKVQAVYDYIDNNVTYDETHPDDGTYLPMYTAYGALINKTAVARGYALLIYRLLLELGVDCRVIPGQLLTGDEHVWNIAKLGSVYYNLDTALDSVVEPDTFFLRNSVLNATHYRYMDYCSLQFHRDYPMSATDYAQGVEGVPEHVFASGICGDSVYWTLDWDGLLVISGTGATYDYKQYYPYEENLSDAAPWFYWQEILKTVVVGEGITRLGDYTFFELPEQERIVSVTLPESLQEIGNRAFLGCANLTEIRIPDGVRKIGYAAFMDCRNLKTVIWGNVEEIGHAVFENCVALTEIQIPENWTKIRESLFCNCKSLTEIRIPDGVKVIEQYAFEGCSDLQTVILNDQLEEIGRSAFQNCAALTEIQFPETLKKIELAAFNDCTSLTEVTIPAGVEVSQGFGGCTGLQKLYIYNSAIGYGAFESCTNLHTVVLSDNVTRIGALAFRDCHLLKQITIPSSVTKLENWIFGWSPLVQEIRFEGDAPEFEDATFSSVIATCYYPAGNPTWTDDKLQNYSGTVIWVAYCNHQWSEGGCDTPRTCALCGETTGHDGHAYDDGVDGTCNFCGVHREDVETREVVHMFRMYNPNTGEHFYTGSEEEKQNLIGHGWHYEGIGFTFPANTGDPVHRLFQPSTGEHLYTMDEAEKNKLMAEGWNYEGIAFNSAYDTEAVQHRLHNPNATVGAYHFTFSEEEKQTLIEAGWEYQGIGWYSCWK